MPKKFPFLKNLEKQMEEAKTSKFEHKRIRKKYESGPSQIAKKMGEEAVEMVIASEKDCDKHFLEESADLLYYYLLAIHARGYSLRDVLLILKGRNKNSK